MSFFYEWRHDAVFRISSRKDPDVYDVSLRDFRPLKGSVSCYGRMISYKCACRIAQRKIVDGIIGTFCSKCQGELVSSVSGKCLGVKKSDKCYEVSVGKGNILLGTMDSGVSLTCCDLAVFKELLFAKFVEESSWSVVESHWWSDGVRRNQEELHFFTDSDRTHLRCQDRAGHRYFFKSIGGRGIVSVDGHKCSYAASNDHGRLIGILECADRERLTIGNDFTQAGDVRIEADQAMEIAIRIWKNEQRVVESNDPYFIDHGDDYLDYLNRDDEYCSQHAIDPEEEFWKEYGCELGPSCNWPDSD